MVLNGPNFLPVGDAATLDVLFLSTSGLPVSGMTFNDVTFATSDESIVVIDAEGFVTGIAEGQATITVRLADRYAANRSATFPIQVIP
jgi:uncharacterized protein YjdB